MSRVIRIDETYKVDDYHVGKILFFFLTRPCYADCFDFVVDSKEFANFQVSEVIQAFRTRFKWIKAQGLIQDIDMPEELKAQRVYDQDVDSFYKLTMKGLWILCTYHEANSEHW